MTEEEEDRPKLVDHGNDNDLLPTVDSHHQPQLEPLKKQRRLTNSQVKALVQQLQQQQQEERPSLSVVDLLPRELVLRIFQLIAPFDLYRKCAFVSKSWHAFITSSEILFEHLLRGEFEAEDVDTFIMLNPQSLQRLHHLVLKSQTVFSRKGLQVVFDTEQMHTLWRQHLLEKRHTLSPNVDTLPQQSNHLGFGRLLLGRYGAAASLQDLPAYSFHRNSFSNNPTQDWTIFNLDKIVPDFPELFDILKVPFVFHVTMPTLQSCEVVYLDGELNVVGKRGCDYVGRTFFVGDYPAGLRYIAISRRPRSVRLILPCKSGSLTAAGMRRFFLH